MRFLGPDADAADEIATFDQLPTAPPRQYCKVLTADLSFGTSNTAVSAFDTTVPVGTWRFQMDADWTTTGTTSNVFFTLNWYSGTVSDSGFKVVRYTGSAIVMSPQQALGTEYQTSTTVPQGATATGFFTVTAQALIGMDIRRAASTTGTMRKGSALIITEVL